MKSIVVTAVHGRADHLIRQLDGLAASQEQAIEHIVIAMSDATVRTTIRRNDHHSRVIEFDPPSHRLPVAAARNLGARAAIDAGADLVIFLDVDCIPAPTMIGSYQRAAEDPNFTHAVLCGPVTYLPPAGPAGYDLKNIAAQVNPHPARPAPPGDRVIATTAYDLFWSLSFAVTPRTWRRIGGFCTEYSGYGGEDTDFGQLAKARHAPMCWVGGAHAFHQYHPVSDPPVEHLADIVVNAKIFHRRWGWWPMGGWLDQFDAAGLIWRDDQGCPHLV